MPKTFILTLLLAVLAGGAAGAQEAASPESTAQAVQSGPPPVSSGYVGPTSGAGLSLYPGDAVKIAIWQEPDLSGTFRVDENGVITLPLLGGRQVEGVTADAFRKGLVRDYALHLKNPAVEVAVLRRVSVTGEVKNAGLYDVEPSMRLGDVLALAGGVTPNGNPENVELHREGVEVAFDAEDPTTSLGNRVRSGDQLIIGQTSWFSRNDHVFIGAAITVTAIMLRQAF
ncbi:MAG: polysaccharide biosynthesis/export family protein [Gemmatimonadetes bacterium]|nr:polysaccharide biosynthesis/export family protein [Gemmatimonadota bacterium]